MEISSALRIVTVISLLLIGILGIGGSVQLGLWGLEGPGPGLFPLLASTLMLVCTLPRLRQAAAPAGPHEPVDWRRLGFYALGLIAFAGLFIPFGFIISGLVGFTLTIRLAEGQSLLRAMTISILVIAASVVLFDYLLSVPLPFGPLLPLRVWM